MDAVAPAGVATNTVFGLNRPWNWIYLVKGLGLVFAWVPE